MKKIDTAKLDGLMKYKADPSMLLNAENQGLKSGYIDPLGSGLLKALFLKSPALLMAKNGAKKVKRKVIKR